MPESGDTAVRRARLATVEDELSRLAARYDLAMSHFKFDEANAVQCRIAALDEERRALAADLPTPAPEPDARPETGVVPALRRPRRARRRR